MIWKALESKDGAEGAKMLEPFALISLAWSSPYNWGDRLRATVFGPIGTHGGLCRTIMKSRICWIPILSIFQSSILSYIAFWATFCQDLFASLGCSSSSVSFNNRSGLTPIANGETFLLEILFLTRSGIMLLVATKLFMFTSCRCFKMFFKSRCFFWKI